MQRTVQSDFFSFTLKLFYSSLKLTDGADLKKKKKNLQQNDSKITLRTITINTTKGFKLRVMPQAADRNGKNTDSQSKSSLL